jgi:serine-type D-Ala-D-Ala carboxypeptidase (penicillin-binding protein 5/6)
MLGKRNSLIHALLVVLFSMPNLAFTKGFDINKYASLLVHPNSGKILHQEKAGYLRNPASLVKMMTLYLTFYSLERGNLHVNQHLYVSNAASKMPRTNLGLNPGDMITVKDAILGLIVHSANDAAVVLAEAISVDEKKFARKMTRFARNLGMYHTKYRNASGLTDPEQKTTAYDMAKLVIALKRDFPQYYPLFSKTEFSFREKKYRSHNRVVRNYLWADGLKTGYTKASGFNIATSASKNGSDLVAVVLGGKSAGSRDKWVVTLLNKGFAKLKKFGIECIDNDNGNIATTNTPNAFYRYLESQGL